MTATPHRTRIKICGITSLDAARAAVHAGADAIGLVFAAGSPRQIDATLARAILDVLPPTVTAIPVYRGTQPDPLTPDAGAEPWPNWCQIHGDVDADGIRSLAAGRHVVRGFEFTPEAVRRWDDCDAVHALLIDGSTGGAGTTFDHAALAAIRNGIRKPLMIAGGLDADNVTAAIHGVRPHAVDVSSGVESAPGTKDAERIEAFCRAVRATDCKSRE